MPSSTSSGPKFRSIKGGGRYRVPPDFLVRVPLAAADFTGATSGVNVFVVPDDVVGAVFLEIIHMHGTAGTNNYRVKKILDGSVSAPGAAADTNNVTISGNIDLTGAAQTPASYAATTANGVNFLAKGDRVALASTLGTITLANGLAILRFAWL